jgi:hypothetical protein
MSPKRVRNVKQRSRTRCPDCDADAAPPAQDADRALKPYIVLNFVAFGVVLYVSSWVYPLLDSASFILIGLAVFSLPALAYYLRYSFAKPPSVVDLPIGKKLQICVGIALWSLVILLVCNCVFDRSHTETQATVISKGVAHHRFDSDSYYLIVESWRPGVSEENLNVGYSTYEAAMPDSIITVDVHNGVFGWPWYTGVEMHSFQGTRGFSDGLNTPSN